MRQVSLIVRLFVAQIAPLTCLGAALAVTGAVSARAVVERTSDRLLAGSAAAIAAQVGAQDGRVTVTVYPWSLGLLDSPERDAVFYSVWEGSRLVTGYADLRAVPSEATRGPRFRYAEMRDMPVRVVQTDLSVPGVARPVSVLVAQTLDSRQVSERELLLGLTLRPLLMVLLAALLVWPAIAWGVRPLRRLVTGIAVRASARRPDMTPVPIEDVPAELVPVIEAFNGLLLSLRNSSEALENFTADASHQLRTPLSVITANLALIDPANPSEHDAELLADSREAAFSLQRVLSQLLALARAEAGVAEGLTDLNAVAWKAVAQTARACSGSNIILRTSDPKVVVSGDEVLITEMIRNLVDNAVQHGGGEVRVLVIGAFAPRVIVWDHGSGIDTARIPAMSERFRRSDVGYVSGSGLGLAIVRSVANALGVSVNIRNRRTRPGLIVELTFPRPSDGGDRSIRF